MHLCCPDVQRAVTGAAGQEGFPDWEEQTSGIPSAPAQVSAPLHHRETQGHSRRPQEGSVQGGPCS